MDQYLVAALALVAFAIFVTGYGIGRVERNSRRNGTFNVHSGRGDLARRSKRVFAGSDYPDDDEPTETGVQPEQPWPRARRAF